VVITTAEVALKASPPERRPFSRLWRNVTWYGLGDGALKGIHTLIEPALTRVLTTAQMGIWGASVVVVAVLQPILSLALFQGVSRAWLRATDDETRAAIAGRGMILHRRVVAWTSVGVSLAAATAAGLGWSLIPLWPYLVLVVATAIIESLVSVPRTLLTMQERASTVVVVSVGSTLTFLGLAALMWTLGWASVASLFVARLVGAIVGFACVEHVCGGWRERAGPADVWDRKMIDESLPYVWHNLSHALLRLGDRWVIGAILGLPAVGLYTAAWFFADAVGLVTGSLNRAIAPQYAKMRETAAGLAYLKRVLAGYMACVQCAVIAACTGAGWVVRAVFGASFHGSATLATWTALAGLPLGMYFVEVNRVFVANRHSKTPRWTVASAVVNLGLTAWWIVVWGLPGAALASVASYTLLYAGIRWEARGVDSEACGHAYFVRSLAGAALCVGVAWATPSLTFAHAMLLALGACAAVALLWASLLLPSHQEDAT